MAFSVVLVGPVTLTGLVIVHWVGCINAMIFFMSTSLAVDTFGQFFVNISEC